MLKGQTKKLLLDRFIKYITIGALIVLTASLAYAQDIGQQIQAQYDSLPARGGVISMTQGGSFSTPICFCTPGKRVLLTGVPGDVVELVYTGTAQWSAAIIFDYGMGHAMGHGMRDITLTGPGNWTNTVGVIFGGDNGAEGFTMRDFKVQGFGVGFALQAHTWIPRIEHGMFRDSRYNVFLPSNMVMAGEQIIFDNVVFADAPAPHTNNVWIMGGGQEVVFRDCSFDQAQLRIGNGSVSAAQVVIDSTHFENSNAGVQGSVPYRYLVVDNNPGNLVRLTNSYFFQGSSNQPDFFVEMDGGTLVMGGNGGWSAAQMSGFITGPGKVVRDQPLVDLGGF